MPQDDRTDGEEPVPLNTIVPEDSPGRMRTTVEADRLRESREEPEETPSVLTDADMPSLDTLDESSDYSGFLSPGVSDRLRKRALRKLFATAVFNVRDGLDDYDEDFTWFEPLGDMVTSDMKHQAEVAERRRLEAEEAKLAEAGESGELQTATEGTPEDEEDEQTEAAPVVDAGSGEEDAKTLAATPDRDEDDDDVDPGDGMNAPA